jgi:hypothetical protein
MNYPRINKGLIIVGSGGHRDSSKRERERERRLSEFSPMALLRGGVAKMAT